MPATPEPDVLERTERRGYRLDVQGLRGLAVLVVVLLHAGLPVPGGFTGVDIFFAISGFVITAALVKRLVTNGHMRMGAFYLARIRRLFPALAVMLTIVLLASVVFGAIGALGITARTGAAAALINANNYLLLFDVGGYFDATADLNPLMHTWSLSVEEQFYLVFPTLVLLSWIGLRHLRGGDPMRRIRWMLIAVIVVSFGLAAWLSLVVPAADAGTLWGRFDYYSAFTRAWEFAAGALLAVTPALVPRGRRAATITGVLGAALIAIGLIVISDAITYPGPLTLLPVLGAVLVMAAGVSDTGNPVSRALSVRPMVGLGNLSYSWYLWHWPFIVFAGIWWSGALAPRVGVAVLSLGAAWLSVRLVENPIRFRPDPTRRSTLLIATACVIVPLIAAGVLAQWHTTLKSDVALNPFALHADSLLDCDSPQPLDGKPAACTWPVVAPIGRAVLVGDSLAGQYSEGFVEGMNAAGLDAQIATLSACPFMQFTSDRAQARALGFAPDKECTSFVRRTMDQLVADPPDIVVISASAQRYLHPSTSLPSQAAAWTQARADMIRRLQDAGSSVILIDPLAKFDGWGPMVEGPFKEAPAITVLNGGSPYNPAVPRAEIVQTLSLAIAAETDAVTSTGATSLDLLDVTCPGDSCSANDGTRWVYRDFEHLSVGTSRSLAPAFRDEAARLMSARPSPLR